MRSPINPQAAGLNKAITAAHPAALHFLSDRGKRIFFPKEGIVAQTAEARGKSINATIGTAAHDNDAPMGLKSLLENININPKNILPYAPSQGLLELRTAWKKSIYEKNPSLQTLISTPLVTCGLTHALSMVGYIFCDEGDTIVSPDLFWGNYKLIFNEAYGTHIETFPMFTAEGTRFNTTALVAKLNTDPDGKKIVLLNFPNNPTGYTPTSAEAKKIVRTCTEAAQTGQKIVAIIDDAYFGLVYEDGIFKESLFALLAAAHENILAIKIDGASKEDYAWGLRVGMITYGIKNGNDALYQALEAKTTGAIRGTISNVSHLSQSLLLTAFANPAYSAEKRANFDILKQRFATTKRILSNTLYQEMFTPLPYNSGYFMCVRLKNGLQAEPVRQLLLKKYDTGVIALGNMIRIAFAAVPNQKIPVLFDAIYLACVELTVEKPALNPTAPAAPEPTQNLWPAQDFTFNHKTMNTKSVHSKKPTLEKHALEAYGLTNIQNIHYNLSFDELRAHETAPDLEGLEKTYETDTGALNVDTGIYTGRSPEDKYIVKEPTTANDVWWKAPGNKSDNRPITPAIWEHLKKIALRQLSGKDLYVVDGYCGANPDTRLKVRFIMEVAWQAHFVTNMFIRPTPDELRDFTPDFVSFNAARATNPQWREQGLHSDIFVAFHLSEKMSLIGGTWYGGEMKKGMFSVMNFYLPLKGIASMHSSANMDAHGNTALFFGLSGTGKTTLSADGKRRLIGDDEHGWDDNGIFNYEGGCYAKMIHLRKGKEPDIYSAIKKDALLENVVIDPHTKAIDFDSAGKTENTRAAFPIYHIKNAVQPLSKGPSPKKVILLTADAFGVLPPVAKLSFEQAQYHYLSGFTAKLAGTERGVTEPKPAFSAAFGAAFLTLHPMRYAQALAKHMRRNDSEAYLVNTGWIGGPYGVGERIDILVSRKIIDAILEDTLDAGGYDTLPIFNLAIPRAVAGVDRALLDPRNSYANAEDWAKRARDLAAKFIKNFAQYTDFADAKPLVDAGPKV